MIRPLYKSVEPFMEVPVGHGFLGVVQYDDQDDKIQCHICGKFFTALAGHLVKHNIKSRDYKEKFGLRVGTPLASLNFLRRQSENVHKHLGMFKGRKMFKHGKDWQRPGMTREWIKKRNRQISKAKNSMTFKNKLGLCDLQIKARYAVVKNIVGHTPTTTEFKKYDARLLTKVYRKFGDFNTFRKWCGDNPIKKGELQTIPDISLISELRKFVTDKGRRPIAKDFTNSCTYMAHFGSWSNALNMAGIK